MKKVIIATLLFATSFGVGTQVLAATGGGPAPITYWAACSFTGPGGNCVASEENGGNAEQCQACCGKNCSNSGTDAYTNCFNCCGKQQDNQPGNECSAVP